MSFFFGTPCTMNTATDHKPLLRYEMSQGHRDFLCSVLPSDMSIQLTLVTSE